MHVRLINPFFIEIVALDLKATSNAGGFDDAFGEIKTKMVDGERVNEGVQKDAVRIRVQAEDETFQALRMFDAGNSPEAKIGFVADVAWLRSNGFIDPETGLCTIKVNDQLTGIFDLRGNLVHKIRTPPGLSCIEVRPISYGIGRSLNLMLFLFNDNALSAPV